MKILLTGAFGYLGRHLQDEFRIPEYEIITLGRNPDADIVEDIAKSFRINEEFDIVVHAAGKAHSVPKTQKEENDFYTVNTIGTHNLLNALQNNIPRYFIFISTVAVYGLEKGFLIDENAPLLGVTPYAKSKIDAEKLVIEWGRQNDVSVLILRLPLITGKNPPGNLGSMINAIKKGYYFRIDSGLAKRSMISARDVGIFILRFLDNPGIYNLTDNIHPTIKATDSYIGQLIGKSIKSLPIWVVSLVVKVGDLIPGFPINSQRMEKLTSSLTFSNAKAVNLGWQPKAALSELRI